MQLHPFAKEHCIDRATEVSRSPAVRVLVDNDDAKCAIVINSTSNASTPRETFHQPLGPHSHNTRHTARHVFSGGSRFRNVERTRYANRSCSSKPRVLHRRLARLWRRELQPTKARDGQPICNYEAAISATGMDAPLLRDYAYVSRHVHRSRRTDKLSWTHHRLVAKLPPEKQKYWLELAANHAEHISVKRLRKSICADRLVSLEELKMPAGDGAIITHIPPINRLTMWWENAGGRDWLRTRSKAQLRNMLVDFKPAIDIVNALTHPVVPCRRSRVEIHFFHFFQAANEQPLFCA